MSILSLQYSDTCAEKRLIGEDGGGTQYQVWRDGSKRWNSVAAGIPRTISVKQQSLRTVQQCTVVLHSVNDSSAYGSASPWMAWCSRQALVGHPGNPNTHPGKLHVHTHAVFGQARSCQSYSGLAAEGITGFRPLRRTFVGRWHWSS